MITNTFEYGTLSVQEEAFVGDDFDGADTEPGRIFVLQLIFSFIYIRNGCLQRRMFGRPEFRIFDDELLHHHVFVVNDIGERLHLLLQPASVRFA